MMSTKSDVPAPAAAKDVPRPMRPAYLSHVVLRTSNVRQMSRWWRIVLAAQSMYADSADGSDGRMAFDFISFDEEHHRIAFVDTDARSNSPPAVKAADAALSPLHHIAFTFASIGDLVANYKYLKSEGILPTYTVHHGPTVSNYYVDPDGNSIELQIDAHGTRAELDEWFRSGEFKKRQGAGPTFDFERMVERYEAGDDPEYLRSPSGFIVKFAHETRKGGVHLR
jgi:catechol 2,3-dioxygenase-like lactoylglutathione lyase family enzyme